MIYLGLGVKDPQPIPSSSLTLAPKLWAHSPLHGLCWGWALQLAPTW